MNNIIAVEDYSTTCEGCWYNSHIVDCDEDCCKYSVPCKFKKEEDITHKDKILLLTKWENS